MMKIRPSTLESVMGSLPALTTMIENAIHMEGHEPETVARALRLPLSEISLHLMAAREARSGAIARWEFPDAPGAEDDEVSDKRVYRSARPKTTPKRRNGPNVRRNA